MTEADDLYLVRARRAKVAHIWGGADTACRMHSTNGLGKSKYIIVNGDFGLPTCSMCKNVKNRGQKTPRVITGKNYIETTEEGAPW